MPFRSLAVGMRSLIVSARTSRMFTPTENSQKEETDRIRVDLPMMRSRRRRWRRVVVVSASKTTNTKSDMIHRGRKKQHIHFLDETSFIPAFRTSVRIPADDVGPNEVSHHIASAVRDGVQRPLNLGPEVVGLP